MSTTPRWSTLAGAAPLLISLRCLPALERLLSSVRLSFCLSLSRPPSCPSLCLSACLCLCASVLSLDHRSADPALPHGSCLHPGPALVAARMYDTSWCPLMDRERDQSVPTCHHSTTRYDTRSYFNARSKADISQLYVPHGTDY